MQGLRGRFPHQVFELSGIGLDGSRVERERLAVDNQGAGFEALECPAQRPEGLAQAAAGLALAPIAPEQPQQLLTRIGLTGMQGKEREQESRFGPLNGDLPARRIDGMEAAEQG